VQTGFCDARQPRLAAEAGGASKGPCQGVSQGDRRFTRVTVKMKVPPALVHVKYKSTICCGDDADTPQMGTGSKRDSVFLGFCCGKSVNPA